MDPQVMRLSSCCVWGHAGGKGLQIGDLTVLPDSHTVQSMSRNCLTLYLNYHNVVLKCQLQSVIPGEKQTFSLTWTIKNYVEEYYQELLWSFFFLFSSLDYYFYCCYFGDIWLWCSFCCRCCINITMEQFLLWHLQLEVPQSSSSSWIWLYFLHQRWTLHNHLIFILTDVFYATATKIFLKHNNQYKMH